MAVRRQWSNRLHHRSGSAAPHAGLRVIRGVNGPPSVDQDTLQRGWREDLQLGDVSLLLDPHEERHHTGDDQDSTDGQCAEDTHDARQRPNDRWDEDNDGNDNHPRRPVLFL